MKRRQLTFDRDTAIDAAMRLFWRTGFDGTSLRDLTHTMGISTSSFYHEFHSKESLFAVTVDRYQTTIGGYPSRLLDLDIGIKEITSLLLREVAHQFTDSSHPPGCYLVCLSTSCVGGSGAARQLVVTSREAARAAIQNAFEKARVSGELSLHVDTSILSRYFVAIIEGMSAQSALGATRDQLLGIAELAMTCWPEPTRVVPSANVIQRA